MIYSGRIIPGRGAWLEFDTDKRDTIGVRVDRKRRQYVSAFLRALSIAETDQEILDLFDGAESIRNTIERDTAARQGRSAGRPVPQAATGRADHGGVGPKPDPDPVPQPQALRPHQGRPLQGRPEVQRRVADTDTEGMLRDEDIVDTIKYLVALHAGQQTMVTHRGVEVKVNTDDIDHFGNRRIRTVGRADPEPGAGRA